MVPFIYVISITYLSIYLYIYLGIQLCNLVNRVVPGINISTEQLKVIILCK